MSAVECPNCRSSVPASSRFCPECGRPLVENGATAEYEARRSRWPPDAGLLIVLLVAAGGIILLAGGEWAWGLVVLLLAGVVFLSQREAERRAVRLTLGALFARVSAHRDVVSARSRGQLDIFRARRELAELEAERTRGYAELGRAVFENDEAGMEAARNTLGDIVARSKRKEDEIQTLLREMDERVRRAQAGVVATEKLAGQSPPEPARIPEPWPPSDEGEPPERTRVAEPSPAEVPEASPGQPARQPEHPPSPQMRMARKRRQKA